MTDNNAQAPEAPATSTRRTEKPSKKRKRSEQHDAAPLDEPLESHHLKGLKKSKTKKTKGKVGVDGKDVTAPQAHDSENGAVAETQELPVEGDPPSEHNAPEGKRKKKRTKSANKQTEKEATPVDEHATKKAPRFIVFVGNLPFGVTTESIAKHFEKIEPTDVRHMTAKDTGKSKGFAFLEFDRYDRMKTCLSLYHHTLFDDGKSDARKINVELTAGGGGSKSEARKAKLKAKNEKLQEERKRKRQEQAKQGDSETKPGTKPGETPEKAEKQDEHVKMHPSRKERLGV